MQLYHSVIEVQGLPLFEKARIKAPYSFNYSLSDRACFFYILEGNYKSIEPFGAIRLRAKESLIKQCSNYISRFLQSPEQPECEAIAIYFHPQIIKQAYKNEIPAFLTKNLKPVSAKKLIAGDLIDKFIQNLLIYFEDPELVDEELAFLKLKELVLILLKSEKRTSVLEFFSEIFYSPQLEFQQIIEHNLFSDITIEQLAFLCNKSLSSFKREFKKIYQESPARYIKSRRLEKAATMLLTTQDRITDIAFDCGYIDLTTFSSSFQKKFGQSPRQYRTMKGKRLTMND